MDLNEAYRIELYHDLVARVVAYHVQTKRACGDQPSLGAGLHWHGSLRHRRNIAAR